MNTPSNNMTRRHALQTTTATALGGGLAGRLWDTLAQSPQDAGIVLEGHRTAPHVVAFSPDSRLLVTTTEGDTTLVRNLESSASVKSPTTLGEPADGAKILAFSSNGKWIATVGRDGQARLFTLAKNATLQATVGMGVGSVQFSPDSRWLATETLTGAQLWDLLGTTFAAPTLVLPVESRDGFFSTQLLFGPSSETVAVAGPGDSVARIWDLRGPASSSSLRRFDRKGDMRSLFLSDGKLITVSSKTVEVWTMNLQELVALGRETAGRELSPEEQQSLGLSSVPSSD